MLLLDVPGIVILPLWSCVFSTSNNSKSLVHSLIGQQAFSLSSLNWSYWNYTWHTNLDTYDKIVFDDVRNNAILTAILAYKAGEDPEMTSREKSVLPISRRTGEQMTWPEVRDATRKGGLD